MPKQPSGRYPQSLEARALEILASRHKATDLILVDARTAQVPSTGATVHRYRAVSRRHANGPQYAVVLDASGAEVDLEKLEKREGVLLFPFIDPSGTAPRPVPPAPPITVSPPSNVLVLNPGDTFTETVVVTVPANAVSPRVDVYFLADTTGSMGPVLNAVQVGANNILAALNGLGLDFHFGVGHYKDFPGDPAPFHHQLNLTNVAADVTNAINAWAANGGGDQPEAQILALHKLAVPSGGLFGWRAGAKRILVWFGDVPGHDPICVAISGEPADITEASATARLVAEQIAVLAISTGNPGLDGDPTLGAGDYNFACGAAGGLAGQGTRIATATGGQFTAVLNPNNIANTIINLVTAAVSGIQNLKLVAAGATAPFVVSIDPPGGYGPLPGDRSHTLTFTVKFQGTAPCKDTDQVFEGTLDVVADGKVVAQKRVRITVPACPKIIYSVKLVCGIQPDCPCECTPVRPGIYATEVNIYNYHDKEAKIEKHFVPVVLAGAPVAREPRSAGRRVDDKVVLPPRTATMDDCCRLSELLFGPGAANPMPLTIGWLEIISPFELAVTAVYTASGLQSGSVSINVEQIPGRKSV